MEDQSFDHFLGQCDGFRKGDNDDFAIGSYTAEDLPLTASILGPTYPNRFSPTPLRPTGSRTTTPSRACPRSGTGWPRLALVTRVASHAAISLAPTATGCVLGLA